MPGIVFTLGFKFVGTVGHDLAVLCVDSQRQLRLGDVIEGLHAHAIVGEGQVADGFSKEDLEADGAGRGHRQNVVLVWTTTPVTPKSTSDFASPKLLFDFYLLGICGRRDGIGHVDNAGNAAADSRGGARGEVFFVGHAGFSEVNVPINDPGRICLPLASISSLP